MNYGLRCLKRYIKNNNFLQILLVIILPTEMIALSSDNYGNLLKPSSHWGSHGIET